MKLRGILAFGAGGGAALLAGWMAFPRALYVQSEQPLLFSHKTHVETSGSACADCHTVEADGRFSGIPGIAKCAECHASALGSTEAEKILVEQYVAHNREIPWKVYSRQPENVWFSHSVHANRAKLTCEECHADHGKTDKLRPYQENRISGYSRDIWGATMTRAVPAGHKRAGMKMSDCESCHAEKGVAAGCMGCHK